MTKEIILDKLKGKISENDKTKISGCCYHKIEDNLYYRPYAGIDSRANVISSSAAMIYNTIGPDRVIFDGVLFDKIEYERPFDVRNNVNTVEDPNPAKLDVSLLSEDNELLVLIESKFLEWFYPPKFCSKAYLSRRCYRKETGSKVDLFITSFKNLLTEPQIEDSKHKGYYIPFYKTYDAIQMNLHILGIYNYCKLKKEMLPKRIKLMNIVWNCDSAKEYKQEEKEGKEYVSFANIMFRNIFRELGIDFSVEYVEFSDFLIRIDWSNDIDHRNYLKRYEI